MEQYQVIHGEVEVQVMEPLHLKGGVLLIKILIMMMTMTKMIKKRKKKKIVIMMNHQIKSTQQEINVKQMI